MPRIWNERCACGYAAMSVRHVLLSCPQWDREREKELEDITRDLKEVLGTKHGATAAIKLILKTGLLEQFKATVQTKEERMRGAGEEQG
jgi:predicted MarR family transcription regulator